MPSPGVHAAVVALTPVFVAHRNVGQRLRDLVDEQLIGGGQPRHDGPPLGILAGMRATRARCVLVDLRQACADRRSAYSAGLLAAGHNRQSTGVDWMDLFNRREELDGR